MERKVTKLEKELRITMTEALKQIGLEQTEGAIIIHKIKNVTLPEGISAEFLETLSSVIVEYDETLNSLKDR
ncbi:AbrB family transcriptional regulator [Paenibacillus rubinfantis]|uniref:AbrB family transcriptional regulator n=1 Tax=Paenibacillus rubinfantis TaxID=1720296 RepID=UPI001E4467E4|nr:AbrB family transcriptional regulator [Paenibacillus rubinfantis]